MLGRGQGLKKSGKPMGAEALRELAENTGAVLGEFDPESACVTYLSADCVDLLGYTPEDLHQDGLLSHVHPDDHGALIDAHEMTHVGEISEAAPIRVKHRDGNWLWIRVTLWPFRTDEGLVRIALVARDVTEQREAELTQARQLDAQTQVAALAKKLLAVSGDQIEAALEDALPQICDLGDAEVVNIVMIDPQQGAATMRLRWHHPEVDARPLDISSEAARLCKWSCLRIIDQEVIHIPHPNTLPVEASAEKARLEERGVCSSLVTPVRSGSGVHGFVIFERLTSHKSWSDSEIAYLSILAEIVASAADRRNRELALQESLQRFRAMAENARELIAEFDEAGVFTYASPSHTAIMGYTPEEIVGTRVADTFRRDGETQEIDRYQSPVAIDSEETIARLKHKRGGWRWIELSARQYCTAEGESRYVTIGRDITHRVEMEQALDRQRQAEQYIAGLSRRFLPLTTDEIEAAILESLPETAELARADRVRFVYLSKDPDGEYPTYEWSAAEIEPLGLDAPSEWGSPIWRQKNAQPMSARQVSSIDELRDSASAQRAYFEGRNLRSFINIPIYGGSRPIASMTFECVSESRTWSDQDVTQLRMLGDLFAGALRRRQTLASLAESRQQLLQAQKMEAVGRLAGGIAHDFNNLLTVILGFSRPLLDDFEEGDPKHEDISAICESADRAAMLTRQLLTFSRRQAIETQPLQLNDLVSQIRPLMESLMGSDVEIAMELGHSLHWVEGDQHQLEQALMNIASNARDAMPDGGQLSIRTRNLTISEDEAPSFGLEMSGRFVELEIGDNGHGMDEVTRQHIFDPFFTTKEQGKGTGLGLSIVYSIVEHAGGTIAVEAEAGKGTTFRILLPACDE